MKNSKSIAKTKSKSDPRVVLVQFPARRAFTLLVTFVLTLLYAAWIWAALRRGDMQWYAIGTPLIVIGLLVNFLQPEEEWQYTPWQEATQKYEKNIYD